MSTKPNKQALLREYEIHKKRREWCEANRATHLFKYYDMLMYRIQKKINKLWPEEGK